MTGYMLNVDKIRDPAGVYGKMQEMGIQNFGHYRRTIFGKQKFLAERENTQNGKKEEGIFTYKKDGTASFSTNNVSKILATARIKSKEAHKKALYECIPWPIMAKTNYEGQKEPGRAKKKFWGTIIRYGPMSMAKFAISQEVATGHPSIVGAAGRIAGPFLALYGYNFIKGLKYREPALYSAATKNGRGSIEILAGRAGIHGAASAQPETGSPVAGSRPGNRHQLIHQWRHPPPIVADACQATCPVVAKHKKNLGAKNTRIRNLITLNKDYTSKIAELKEENTRLAAQNEVYITMAKTKK